MAHALIGVVVQVDVRDFDVTGRQRIGIDDKAVILGGDLDVPGAHVFYRVIRAMMAEFEFVSAAAQSETAKLVPQANAEYGYVAEQLADIFDAVGNGFRIAGSVGKKYAIRLHRQNLFGGSPSRNDLHFALRIDEDTKDVLLNAEIVGHYTKALGFLFGSRFVCLGHREARNRTLIPAVRLCTAHPTRQFETAHGGNGARFFDEPLGRRSVGRDDSAKSADLADVPNQCACVEVPDYRNAVAFQIMLRGFGGAPVGGQARKFAHNERFDERPRGFLVIEIRADIADVWIGEADNLAGIAGIAENFLIAGEAGIKNDFAAAPRAGACSAPVKESSVLERENGRPFGYFRQRFLQKRSWQEPSPALTTTFGRVYRRY
jgi:hypothetical protein